MSAESARLYLRDRCTTDVRINAMNYACALNENGSTHASRAGARRVLLEACADQVAENYVQGTGHRADELTMQLAAHATAASLERLWR